MPAPPTVGSSFQSRSKIAPLNLYGIFIVYKSKKDYNSTSLHLKQISWASLSRSCLFISHDHSPPAKT